MGLRVYKAPLRTTRTFPGALSSFWGDRVDRRTFLVPEPRGPRGPENVGHEGPIALWARSSESLLSEPPRPPYVFVYLFYQRHLAVVRLPCEPHVFIHGPLFLIFSSFSFSSFSFSFSFAFSFSLSIYLVFATILQGGAWSYGLVLLCAALDKRAA